MGTFVYYTHTHTHTHTQQPNGLEILHVYSQVSFYYICGEVPSFQSVKMCKSSLT